MTSQYFAADLADDAPRHWVEFSVAGVDYRLVAAGGVFSAHRLDPGTAVLLRKAPLPTGSGPYLDLGCGYGPIACVLANSAPSSKIYAVDVNPRARALTASNAISLGFSERLLAASPDEVALDLKFAEIWSNPPVRVGKTAMYALLDEWLPRLTPDGVAWLVVGRHLGGDSLAKHLIDNGWSCTRHASQKGYRVLRVTR